RMDARFHGHDKNGRRELPEAEMLLKMRLYKKAILPLRFKANGVSCGIKKSEKLDLALFYSQVPAKASCLFTTNKIAAAPILLNRQCLKINKEFRAIIVNSGNANCFNGQQGLKDARETAGSLANALGVKKEGILVNSTGIIGRRLPLLKIKNAIPALIQGLSEKNISQAKQAIMTTDTFVKEVTIQFSLDKKITICGVAKGAGMIAPDMATMLSFIFTDANITQEAQDKALRIAVEKSFNCITVDGCMSTNDTVILLANGAAGNGLIDIDKNFDIFIKALELVCLELAWMIVRDAEGATKFIRIKVNQAKTFFEARRIALSIANSNLFKTAMYGENPNFGRIAAGMGASGIDVKERDVKIKVSSLNKKEITVNVFVKRGDSCAEVYTSDLTPEYVKINAEYN
ncbi:MAG: bifunctional glutamate N-acetyltransferase/amino-acid acetyltransferase ArgJ, partial [Candidatus Omnitrophota bacterium]|nr:bifunctional glutamate N-acetyltransferase/amino-acid acetyltransferase ArgJ [Candidatus Omnitrophota bacterium]